MKVKILHESFSPKKRDKTPLGQLWFSQTFTLINLQAWWKLRLQTMHWSHKETHSWIKTLVCPRVTNKNWPFSDLSTHGGLRLLVGETEVCKTSSNDTGVTPEEVKLKSNTLAHHTIPLVNFIQNKFNLKWWILSTINSLKLGNRAS